MPEVLKRPDQEIEEEKKTPSGLSLSDWDDLNPFTEKGLNNSFSLKDIALHIHNAAPEMISVGDIYKNLPGLDILHNIIPGQYISPELARRICKMIILKDPTLKLDETVLKTVKSVYTCTQ